MEVFCSLDVRGMSVLMPLGRDAFVKGNTERLR